MDMFYSLIIAFTYAIYLVMQKMNTRFDKFFALTIHILLCACILIPYGYPSVVAADHSTTFYQLVLLIAVLFTIIPLFLNMYALKSLSSSLLGILLYINPIIAFLLAVFYFGESVNSTQAIAYGIVLFAVVVFNLAYLKGSKAHQLVK